MTTNLEGYTGEYQGAGERKKNGRWFKGTHFSLGQDKSTHHYSQSQRAQLPLVQGGEKTIPLNDANKMRATHFVLGDEKRTGISTNDANFQEPPNDFRKQQLDQETKDNLRKSHFDVGAGNGTYNTTHGVHYQGKQSQATKQEKISQNDRRAKMRNHNFNFGDDRNNFVSMNTATYRPQGSTTTGKIQNEDIRKTHFTLGEQSAAMMTEHQREYIEKEGQGVDRDSKTSTKQFQSTNFVFGDDDPTKISSSHIHYHHYPGQQEGLNTEKQGQLRQTHFSLGNHPGVKESVNQMAYQPKSTNYEKANKDFQKTNFSLGDGGNQYATSYGSACAPAAVGGHAPAQPVDNRSFKSSFDIGGGKFQGKTQFQSAYTPQNYSASQADKEFINKIKSNHFDLAEDTAMKGQYLTENQSQFQDKGDPMKIRSNLDENRKADLRCSHFDIGGNKVPFTSTMQSSFTPQQRAAAAFNDEKARDLKNSHFNIGEGQKMDYSTQNTINYRWVQPREQTSK